MKRALQSNEKVNACGGYQDERCKTPDDVYGGSKKECVVVRARHETVSRRLEQFFTVGHRFRHEVSHHSACFHAVAILKQLMMENKEPFVYI